MLSWPPAISAVPLFRRVAVEEVRPVFRLPVTTKPLAPTFRVAAPTTVPVEAVTVTVPAVTARAIP